MSNLFFDIDSKYHSLSSSAKKIADYLRKHKYEVQYLSISSFAKKCGVGEATIFRFCKNLGFKGYNEFRIALAKSTSNANNSKSYASYTHFCDITKDSSIKDMCNRLYSANIDALKETLELVDENSIKKAGDLLWKANKVFCFGQGGSLITALEAWGRFLTISSKFFSIEDHHMQVMASSLLEKDDVVLFVSYSGSTLDAKNVLQPARDRGAKIILITHFSDSPASELADVVLLCGTHEGPLQSGSIAAKMAMLFVVDILVNEYCRRDIKLTMGNKDITSQALSNCHL